MEQATGRTGTYSIRKVPDLKTAFKLFLKLVDIFNKKSSSAVAGLSFARWYNEVEAFGNNRLNKVLETFENHNRRILNYFKYRLTNTPLRNHSMPKSKLSARSFRALEILKSLSSDRLNYTPDTTAAPTENIS